MRTVLGKGTENASEGWQREETVVDAVVVAITVAVHIAVIAVVHRRVVAEVDVIWMNVASVLFVLVVVVVRVSPLRTRRMRPVRRLVVSLVVSSQRPRCEAAITENMVMAEPVARDESEFARLVRAGVWPSWRSPSWNWRRRFRLEAS